MTVCHNATTPPHEIADGSRKLEVGFTVDWGDDDLRDSHSKPLTFCSFGCLAGWATEKAVQHDGATVVEGPAA